MTDDIVNDLRRSKWNENPDTNVTLCNEAADEIERLRAENERLRAEVARLGSFIHPIGSAIYGIEDMYER